jgi:hypothetical protein
VFVASVDHVGITKASGSEVCFVYPLNLWNKRHSVDTPISGILSTREKPHEIPCLSEELYYPGKCTTDIVACILKGGNPRALEAAIRAMEFVKKIPISADDVRKSSLGVYGWASLDPTFLRDGGTPGYHNPYPPVQVTCHGERICAICRSNVPDHQKALGPGNLHHIGLVLMSSIRSKNGQLEQRKQPVLR